MNLKLPHTPAATDSGSAKVQRKSIKVRVTLLILIIFLVGIWSLALYVSKTLRNNFVEQLSEQQLSVASVLANNINHQFNEQLEDLQAIAATITHLQAADVAVVQQRLRNLTILQRHFNGGIYLIGADNAVLAHVPPAHANPAQSQPDLRASDAIATVLASGRPAIGGPKIDKQTNTPAFHMTVPIKDAEGRTIGALSGAINLSKTGFLDQIGQNRFGNTGGYLVVDPQHRLIVTATDKHRILEPSPAPEKYPEIARFLSGEEGTAIFTTPHGIEVFQSVRRIPVNGWYVAVALPTAEAFQPIAVMHRQMLLAALILSVCVGSLTWWLLRRQLSPLVDTLQSLKDLIHQFGNTQQFSLPTVRNDEIGQLVNGFNELLSRLNVREEELRVTTDDLLESQKISGVGSWQQDLATGDISISVETRRIFELPENVHSDDFKLLFYSRVHPTDRDEIHERFLHALTEHAPYEVTFRLQLKSGKEKWIYQRGVFEYTEDGQPLRASGTLQDITAMRLTEEALRQAKQQMDSIVAHMPAMIFLKRADDLSFALLNQAGEELLGYRAAELVGKSDRDLFPPEQADAFIARDREVLASPGAIDIPEEQVTIASGETRTLYTRKVALRDIHDQPQYLLGISIDISARKRSEERINQLAFFDQLTGLPNRTLLLDRLRQTLATHARSGQYGALLFIDLDKFKTLNDSFGHDRGDLLLQQVAERLATCVRAGDTIARLGGDEFVVMLTQLNSNTSLAGEQVEMIGEKILHSLNQPYQLINVVHHCSASIGATLFNAPRDEVEALLKQADLAMYKAKAAGRNALRFFDPEMESEVLRRTHLERDLRNALELRQLQLHYQAQITGGILSGTEALVRWLHPERGLIPPDEFISLAEETGLIETLGRWVLETACLQLVRWAKVPELKHLSIAVNVSARQFRKADFVAEVSEILSRTGVNPRHIKLELTESLLVEDVDNVIEKMHALKNIGVGFALDDFGTGYSSLYYLKHLPFDQMKIDRSFVRDILDDTNDATIARTIVTLAQSLGLGVIAEGVESQEQLDFLAELHCYAYQGYFFSHPLPIDEFEEYALGY